MKSMRLLLLSAFVLIILGACFLRPACIEAQESGIASRDVFCGLWRPFGYITPMQGDIVRVNALVKQQGKNIMCVQAAMYINDGREKIRCLKRSDDLFLFYSDSSKAPFGVVISDSKELQTVVEEYSSITSLRYTHAIPEEDLPLLRKLKKLKFLTAPNTAVIGPGNGLQAAYCLIENNELPELIFLGSTYFDSLTVSRELIYNSFQGAFKDNQCANTVIADKEEILKYAESKDRAIRVRNLCMYSVFSFDEALEILSEFPNVKRVILNFSPYTVDLSASDEKLKLLPKQLDFLCISGASNGMPWDMGPRLSGERGLTPLSFGSNARHKMFIGFTVDFSNFPSISFESLSMTNCGCKGIEAVMESSVSRVHISNNTKKLPENFFTSPIVKKAKFLSIEGYLPEHIAADAAEIIWLTPDIRWFFNLSATEATVISSTIRCSGGAIITALSGESQDWMDFNTYRIDSSTPQDVKIRYPFNLRQYFLTVPEDEEKAKALKKLNSWGMPVMLAKKGQFCIPDVHEEAEWFTYEELL